MAKFFQFENARERWPLDSIPRLPELNTERADEVRVGCAVGVAQDNGGITIEHRMGKSTVYTASRQ